MDDDGKYLPRAVMYKNLLKYKFWGRDGGPS
jgi:hypothetical protein